jgi:hypothetical protein
LSPNYCETRRSTAAGTGATVWPSLYRAELSSSFYLTRERGNGSARTKKQTQAQRYTLVIVHNGVQYNP